MAPLLINSLFVLSMRMIRGKELKLRQPGHFSYILGKQLDDGGFLQCPPQLASAVAADLAAPRDPAAITQQLQDKGYESVMAIALGSSLHALHSTAYHFHMFLDFARCFWPEQDFSKVAPVREPAVAQLSAAVMRNVSCSLEHLAPQQQLISPPGLLDGLLVNACLWLLQLAGGLGS